MALLFIDSFDHYATADLNQKYTNVHSVHTIGAYGRFSTNGLRSSGSNVTPTALSRSITGTDVVFAGFALKYTNVADSSGESILSFNEDTTIHVDLRIKPNGTLSFTRNGTAIGTGTYAVSTGVYNYIEAKVVIADSPNGSVQLRVNGTTVISDSSLDTKNGGTGNINRVLLGFNTNLTVGTNTVDFDDYYISDDAGSAPYNTFLGDCRVEVLLPTGAGTTTDWSRGGSDSGSNYGQVDETSTNSDTDYITTDVANEIDTYAMGNLATTGGTIYGVQTVLVARKDDAGSRSIAPVLRPASTDRVGTTVSLGDNYSVNTEMFSLNPEDSAAWEIADVNGTEFGVKLIS
jgi:hypothetical protein